MRSPRVPKKARTTATLLSDLLDLRRRFDGVIKKAEEPHFLTDSVTLSKRLVIEEKTDQPPGQRCCKVNEAEIWFNLTDPLPTALVLELENRTEWCVVVKFPQGTALPPSPSALENDGTYRVCVQSGSVVGVVLEPTFWTLESSDNPQERALDISCWCAGSPGGGPTVVIKPPPTGGGDVG
jgi:hypothetical protein